MPVRMNVMSHQLVGAFLSRLAATGERPETVEAMMNELAEFVNRELGVETIGAYYDCEASAWRIPGVLEMIDVKREARASYATHSDDEIIVRLPDPDLLAESRNFAIALDTGNQRARIYVHPFYYDYLRRDAASPSNSEFLDSRIADYTFSSCR